MYSQNILYQTTSSIWTDRLLIYASMKCVSMTKYSTNMWRYVSLEIHLTLSVIFYTAIVQKHILLFSNNNKNTRMHLSVCLSLSVSGSFSLPLFFLTFSKIVTNLMRKCKRKQQLMSDEEINRSLMMPWFSLITMNGIDISFQFFGLPIQFILCRLFIIMLIV